MHSLDIYTLPPVVSQIRSLRESATASRLVVGGALFYRSCSKDKQIVLGPILSRALAASEGHLLLCTLDLEISYAILHILLNIGYLFIKLIYEKQMLQYTTFDCAVPVVQPSKYVLCSKSA